MQYTPEVFNQDEPENQPSCMFKSRLSTISMTTPDTQPSLWTDVFTTKTEKTEASLGTTAPPTWSIQSAPVSQVPSYPETKEFAMENVHLFLVIYQLDFVDFPWRECEFIRMMIRHDAHQNSSLT